MKYLQQQEGSCCFVYAVANCLIYIGQDYPPLEDCFREAICLNGATIDPRHVVKFMKAPLVEGTFPKVLECGGILTIRHPIWNLHSIFVYPENGSLTAINSWLGPNVARTIGKNDLLQFYSSNDHWNWVLKEG